MVIFHSYVSLPEGNITKHVAELARYFLLFIRPGEHGETGWIARQMETMKFSLETMRNGESHGTGDLMVI